MNNDCPCYGCNDERSATCHASCERYRNWSSKRRVKSEEKRAAIDARELEVGFAIKRRVRAWRSMRAGKTWKWGQN